MRDLFEGRDPSDRDAAVAAGSIATMFSTVHNMDPGESGDQYCQEGFESMLRLRASYEEDNPPTDAWRGGGALANRCTPRGFGNFICDPLFDEFRRAHQNYEYSNLVRDTVVAAARPRNASDDGAGSYRDITQSYDPEHDRCVCSNQSNGCTGTPQSNPGPAMDRDGRSIDPATASSDRCQRYRQSFYGLMQARHATPELHQEMQRRLQNQTSMQHVRDRILPNLKQSLIASLSGRPIRIVQGRVSMDLTRCTTLGTTEHRDACPEEQAFRGRDGGGPVFDRLIQSINDVEVTVPEMNVCFGNDDNVMTVRRPGGGLRIYICPRALIGGNLNMPALQTSLANAMGHALDSCALEQMRVPMGNGRVSLARLGDGLRACLAENHLRIPPLPTAAPSPGYVGIQPVEMTGLFRRPSLQSDDQARLEFLQGSLGSHCTTTQRASAGSTYDETGGIQTNALEAQYWGTRAVTGLLSLRSETGVGTVAQRAFGMQSDDPMDWENFCNQAYAGNAAKKNQCLGFRRGENANYFHLRNSYAPFCRDMLRRGAQIRRGNYPDSDRLFEVTARDPDLRRLMGCTNDQVNPILNTQFFRPADPPSSTPVRPHGAQNDRRRTRATPAGQPGHCQSQAFLEQGLGHVTNHDYSPQNASPELRPGDPPRNATGSGGTGAVQSGDGAGATGTDSNTNTNGDHSAAGGSEGNGAARPVGTTTDGSPSAPANPVAAAQGPGGRPRGMPREGSTLSPDEAAILGADPTTQAAAITPPSAGATIVASQTYVNHVLNGPAHTSVSCVGAGTSCGELRGVSSDGFPLRYFGGPAARAVGCPGNQPCYCNAILATNGEFHCETSPAPIPATQNLPAHQQINSSTYVTVPNSNGNGEHLEVAIPGGSVPIRGTDGQLTGATGIIYWPQGCLDGTRTCNGSHAMVREPGSVELRNVRTSEAGGIQTARPGAQVPFQYAASQCPPSVNRPAGATRDYVLSMFDGAACRYNCAGEGAQCTAIANSAPPGGTVENTDVVRSNFRPELGSQEGCPGVLPQSPVLTRILATESRNVRERNTTVTTDIWGHRCTYQCHRDSTTEPWNCTQPQAGGATAALPASAPAVVPLVTAGRPGAAASDTISCPDQPSAGHMPSTTGDSIAERVIEPVSSGSNNYQCIYRCERSQAGRLWTCYGVTPHARPVTVSATANQPTTPAPPGGPGGDVLDSGEPIPMFRPLPGPAPASAASTNPNQGRCAPSIPNPRPRDPGYGFHHTVQQNGMSCLYSCTRERGGGNEPWQCNLGYNLPSDAAVPARSPWEPVVPPAPPPPPGGGEGPPNFYRAIAANGGASCPQQATLDGGWIRRYAGTTPQNITLDRQPNRHCNYHCVRTAASSPWTCTLNAANAAATPTTPATPPTPR